jgi:HemX protein
VWMSVIVLVTYAFILYKRLTDTWEGRKLALWNMIGFLMIICNVLLTDTSSFHHWL